MSPTYMPLTAIGVARAMTIIAQYAPTAEVFSVARGWPFTYVMIDTGPIDMPLVDRQQLMDLGWAYMPSPMPGYTRKSPNEYCWVHGYWPNDRNGEKLTRAQVLAYANS